MPSQNINAGTITPSVNPESILVDLDPEEDLEEIQRKAAAEQVRIEEAAQAKLAAAHEHIERKWKVKEEEAWKAKEEEVRKVADAWKAEEDEALRKKAKEDAHRWQLSVSCRFFCAASVLICSRC